jgi:hypothetical protein
MPEQGDSTRVTFSRSLYLPEALEAAAGVYAPLAEVMVEHAGNEVTAVVSTADREIVDAFCNHVLYETVNRRRAERPGAP